MVVRLVALEDVSVSVCSLLVEMQIERMLGHKKHFESKMKLPNFKEFKEQDKDSIRLIEEELDVLERVLIDLRKELVKYESDTK